MQGLAEDGLDQAIQYARLLDVPFAYNNLIEFNLKTAKQRVTVFVKILQKNWLGVFLSLKNLSRGFAPTLRYPRIFF